MSSDIGSHVRDSSLRRMSCCQPTRSGDHDHVDEPGSRSVVAPIPEAAVQYTAFVLSGNGACLFQSCLQARPAWRTHVRGKDEQSDWHLWWGSNGQACPFKRLREGMAYTASWLRSGACLYGQHQIPVAVVSRLLADIGPHR